MPASTLGPHAYNDVDRQEDPQSWIRVLDDLAQEPFYARYKARIGELLDLQPGETYLDVGGGAGSDLIRRTDHRGVWSLLVDRSATMCADARRRGLPRVLRADAAALPLRDGSVQACSADRVLQHLHDPAGALREMVRVTGRGGRIVIADPDYDTQVVECEDQDLARCVLRFRSDHLLRNGSIAHRTPGLLLTAGARTVESEAHVLVVRDPTAVSNVMGLRTWAGVAWVRGLLPAEDANRWPAQLAEAAAAGRFFYAVTFFLTTGRV